MKTVDVDILVPSYNGYDDLVKLVDKFKKQRFVNIVNIVIPITLANKDNDEKLKEFCLQNNIITFEVEQWYFSHSLTRQRAIKKHCTSDVVILYSQDVKLINDMAFYNLVKDVASGECAYTYGRQICPKKSLEKYIREKNYPMYSYYVTKDDIPNMGIMAFFASDAFSAINRKIFLEIGGYQDYDIMMGEDMLYSYFVLQNGYKKKYCADAVVIHYHRYSLKALYKRYYDTGKFYKDVKLFDGQHSSQSGYKLAMYVLKRCFQDFYIPGLIRWLPDMAMRYLGMKRGRNSKNERYYFSGWKRN